jgi:predicted Holliday junction resolvase-like endonuclease
MIIILIIIIIILLLLLLLLLKLGQHTRKAINLGTTENNHIWHRTRTAGSANVTVQKRVSRKIT